MPPPRSELKVAVDRFWDRLRAHASLPAVIGAGIGIDPCSGHYEEGLLVHYKLGTPSQSIEAIRALAEEVVREVASGAPVYVLPLAEPKIQAY